MMRIAVTGATASGKSDFALELARCLRDKRGMKAEIVSCDSVQVYRGFNVGAAKPVSSELAEFPHHMIDIVTWRDELTVRAQSAVDSLHLAAFVDYLREQERVNDSLSVVLPWHDAETIAIAADSMTNKW